MEYYEEITPKCESRIANHINALYDRLFPRIDRSLSRNGVWHYTNIDALYGIVSNSYLLLGCAAYMNDKNELSSSYKLIQESIKKYGADRPQSINEIFKTNGHRNVFKLKSLANRTFLMSFTTKKDLLSQWRGYANSNNGIAIKFSVSALQRLVKKLGHQFNFAKVEYDDNTKIIEIKKFTQRTDKSLQLYPPSSNELNSIASQIDILLGECTCLFKDPNWSEECEYRLIGSDIQEIEPNIPCEIIRQSRYGVVKPFMKVDIECASIITEIMFLNKKSRIQEQRFISKYLKPFGLENIKISYSSLNMQT